MKLFKAKESLFNYPGYLFYVEDVGASNIEYRLFKAYINNLNKDTFFIQVDNEKQFHIPFYQTYHDESTIACIKVLCIISGKFYWFIKEQLVEV